MYTDGACSYNPGPGGWACILEYKGKEKEFSGFEAETTNNKMEVKSLVFNILNISTLLFIPSF